MLVHRNAQESCIKLFHQVMTTVNRNGNCYQHSR